MARSASEVGRRCGEVVGVELRGQELVGVVLVGVSRRIALEGEGAAVNAVGVSEGDTSWVVW